MNKGKLALLLSSLYSFPPGYPQHISHRTLPKHGPSKATKAKRKAERKARRINRRNK